MDTKKIIDYINDKFIEFKIEFKQELKEELKGEFVTKKEFSDFKKIAYDKLDLVIKELQAVRQEQAALTHFIERTNGILENHEQRIASLEGAI